MGPETRVAFQLHLETRPDSVIRPTTVRTLQRRVAATRNGIWDRETTLALQRALNAGTF